MKKTQIDSTANPVMIDLPSIACSVVNLEGNIGSHNGLVGTISVTEPFADGIQRVVALD
jgi:hypothetical protein